MADDSGGLHVEDRERVRILTIDRPARRNAFDLEVRVVLAEALEAAMADDGVRVIVLTGAGGTFCSGGDITTMRRQPAAKVRPRAAAAARVIRAMWSGSKPVIAAVEGYAFGAGLALAIACDRVVMAENATLNASFTRVGLAGDLGIFASLPHRVGPARARQMLMLPESMTGAEALAIGLADAAVPPGTALDAALDDARRLAEGPPLALAAIKSMLAAEPTASLAMLDREVDLQTRLFDTEDFAEGVAAFHERRTPRFRGR